MALFGEAHNKDEFIKTTYNGNYFNRGDYLQVVIYELDRLIKNIEDCNIVYNERLEELEDKLSVLLKNNKQKFRWVESHWELVDDE